MESCTAQTLMILCNCDHTRVAHQQNQANLFMINYTKKSDAQFKQIECITNGKYFVCNLSNCFDWKLLCLSIIQSYSGKRANQICLSYPTRSNHCIIAHCRFALFVRRSRPSQYRQIEDEYVVTLI